MHPYLSLNNAEGRQVCRVGDAYTYFILFRPVPQAYVRSLQRCCRRYGPMHERLWPSPFEQ